MRKREYHRHVHLVSSKGFSLKRCSSLNAQSMSFAVQDVLYLISPAKLQVSEYLRLAEKAK